MTGPHSVVVTGAAQGIGAAIATSLAHEGWQVACVDVDEHSLDATVSELRAAGLRAAPYVCDLGDAAAIRALWAELDTRGVLAEALVNNAGIFYRDPALDVEVEDWDRVIDVNLRAPFLMAQQLARRVRDRRADGAVISVSSGQAYRPGSVGAAYAASKAGLSNLTRALAREWGPLGIRVNTVVPGLTDTAQPRAAKDDGDFAEAAAANPLGRLSTPDDIAAMVAFLLSSKAAAVTGQAFVVNAGRLML